MSTVDASDAARPLTGKVAIVTGASAGLGAVLAAGLARAGCDVAVCARRVDRIEALTTSLTEGGHRALAVGADVSIPEDCQRVVDETMAAFGRVDVLVNNAGVGTAVPSTRETPEAFRRVIDVNLMGSFWMAQACARVMQPGSSILNIGSVLGATTAGLPQAAYISSKAAIIGLTRDLAQEWTGRKGIRVNALAPGFFPTEMTEHYPDGYLDTMLFRVPAGRHGDPEEIVGPAVFLSGPGASYITGAVLPVDGGLLTS